MQWWWTKRRISELKVDLPRHELVRRSRILMIDDEKPDILEDMKHHGFSLDHEFDGSAPVLSKIEQRLYDLVLLDFGDVGTEFGTEQGLSILRHVKRTSPATVVFAYTSKALDSSQSDFYRLSDGVLAKDGGIQDSMDKIEQGLREAHSIKNVWRGLLYSVGVREGSSEDLKLQNMYVRSLDSKRKMDSLREYVLSLAASPEAKSIATTLIGKLAELGLQAVGVGL